MAAFANAEGGVLILGIEDDHTLTGHRLPPDALEQLLQTPRTRLLPAQPEGFEITVGETSLLVFDVPAADMPVQVVGNGFPLRIGDKTVQARESQIRTLKLRAWPRVGKAAPRPTPWTISTGYRLQKHERAQACPPGATRSTCSNASWQTVAAAACNCGRAAELLFAREEPDQPNAGVHVFRVIGSERRTGPEHNVEERPRIEGNLPAVIDEAAAVVGSLLRRPSRLVGTRFRAVTEYPEFSWKEALLNAVAHRDYAVEGAGTEIWLFEDRMEVISPGGLLGDLTLDEVLSLKSACIAAAIRAWCGCWLISASHTIKVKEYHACLPRWRTPSCPSPKSKPAPPRCQRHTAQHPDADQR